jgi:ATP-dependent Clp protease ATP-binding subunit ClpC
MTMERWTPESRKVAELALREALSLGHNYVGPEHILLALIRVDDTIANGALEQAADLNWLRERVFTGIKQRAEARKPASRLDAIETRLDSLEAQPRIEAA